jgi:DNA replication protein DnaC
MQKLERLKNSIASKIPQEEERELENWERNQLFFDSTIEADKCFCKDPGKCKSKGFQTIRFNTPDRYSRWCSRYKKWEEQQKISNAVNSIMPEKLRKLSFRDFDGERSPQSKIALGLCLRYYKKKAFMKGSNLILAGSCGNGKSHLASAILHNSMIKGYSCGFVTASSLNRGGFNEIEQRFEVLKNVDLVVVDDLYDEPDNQLIMRHLFNFINYRYEVEKGIVITTNYTQELFEKAVDVRIWDRLRERLKKWIEIDDVESFRGKINKYKEW